MKQTNVDENTLSEFLKDPVKRVYLQEEMVRAFKLFQEQENDHKETTSIKKIYQKFEHILNTLHNFYEQLRVVKKKRLNLEEKIQKKEDTQHISDMNKLIDSIPE